MGQESTGFYGEIVRKFKKNRPRLCCNIRILQHTEDGLPYANTLPVVIPKPPLRALGFLFGTGQNAISPRRCRLSRPLLRFACRELQRFSARGLPAHHCDSEPRPCRHLRREAASSPV